MSASQSGIHVQKKLPAGVQEAFSVYSERAGYPVGRKLAFSNKSIERPVLSPSAG